MDPSGNFPKARAGNDSMHGGFGFSGPSEAWLRANGMLKHQYISGSSALEENEISQEEKEKRRKKALERFGKPQEEVKLLPEPIKKRKEYSTEEIRKKEEIARRREEALMKNQNQLDNMKLVEVDDRKPIVFSSEKREKCLSWLKRTEKRQVVEFPQALVKVNLQNLINSESSDFFLQTDDGTRIGAHRIILAARSQFFRALLASNSSEAKTGTLIIHEYSSKVVRYCLEFIYSGTANADNQDIMELLYLAEYFRIENLKLIIENQLCGFISLDNLINLWELSEDLKLSMLKRACLRFCEKNPEVKKLAHEMPREIKAQYFKLIKDKAL